MKKLNFLVSLITSDNDYQVEQAKAAEEMAQRLGVSVQVIYAGNDAINQSQQLLSVIQSSGNHPDGIIVEPVGGTAFPHVARAAVTAGIGWAVLNRETDYVNELRRSSRVPTFCVSSNHLEVGRIQGRQVAALVPKGGTVIYIQGPSTTAAARYRALGIEQTKPANVKLVQFKGNWTGESAYKAMSSWMQLSTSKKTPFDMISAQNDDMAMGARRAIQEHADPEVRDKWLRLPFTGCDGLPNTGQAFVRSGLLAATVVMPPNTSVALEMLVEGVRTGRQPTEVFMTSPTSLPAIDELSAAAQKGVLQIR
jgi:ABC-type sugar transport system substrate-binding protein